MSQGCVPALEIWRKEKSYGGYVLSKLLCVWANSVRSAVQHGVAVSMPSNPILLLVVRLQASVAGSYQLQSDRQV